MNFSSSAFWQSLFLMMVALYALRGGLQLCGVRQLKRFDSLMLGGISSILLFSESKITFFVFLYVLLTSWGAAKAILKLKPSARSRRWLMVGFVCLQLIPLLFFKYFSFFSSVFGYEYSYYEGYIIPVGISFYTFQLIGYVIDLNREVGTSASIVEEYNFACFFPQIVAGPIERKENLLPQIKSFSFDLKMEHVLVGLKISILGLFYKMVMGDNLAAVSGWCVEDSNNPFVIWLGSVFFGLRIYFDFAGYSLIAVGLGRIFGIHLTQNFKSPYTALNIRQFWARWHRTLSTWFRDYLYIPLGGGRVRWWWINILLVFVLSGIWHGAGCNFVIWGFAHGVMLILYKFMANRIALPRCISWGITMAFVVFSWLCFYETNTVQLIHKMQVIFSPMQYNRINFIDSFSVFGTGLDILAAGLIAGLAAFVIAIEFVGLKKSDDPYSFWINHNAVSCITIIVIYLCACSGKSGFIYFNF